MSMNLHLKVNGAEYNLLQTPTYITYLLMTTDDGNVMYEIKGKKAKGVLSRYISFLEYLRQNACNASANDRQQQIEINNDYSAIIDQMTTLMKSKSKLNFYIL